MLQCYQQKVGGSFYKWSPPVLDLIFLSLSVYFLLGLKGFKFVNFCVLCIWHLKEHINNLILCLGSLGKDYTEGSVYICVCYIFRVKIDLKYTHGCRLICKCLAAQCQEILDPRVQLSLLRLSPHSISIYIVCISRFPSSNWLTPSLRSKWTSASIWRVVLKLPGLSKNSKRYSVHKVHHLCSLTL